MTTMQIPGPGWRLFTRGAMADLYLVPRDEGGDPMVAKVLREITSETRRWFAREFRVLSTRVHPGLVPVLGGDPEALQPYYFMPFLSGGTLTQFAGALEHGLLRSVACWLAQAIAPLHAYDMQHGDIKPDNILITRRGTAQVSDPLGNGSGCTVSWGTKTGGTPGYMAPEIAAGAPISKAGDVFSLGATLFHLATGIRPEHGMVLDPAAYGVILPPDLQRAIVGMCRQDPSRRPTMQQIAQFLSGLPTNAAPPQPPARPQAPAPSSTDVPAWLKVLSVAFGAAAVINSTTKTWDGRARRYRGSDGKFRGNGLFD